VTAQQRTLAGTRNPEKEPGEGTRRRTCTDCTCGAGRNSSVTICAARRRASAAARGTAVRAAERMGAHQIILNFNDDLTKIYFHPEVEELKGRPGRECSRDQRTWTCAACRAALSSVWPTGGASVCGKGASCGRSRQGAAGAARGGAGRRGLFSSVLYGTGHRGASDLYGGGHACANEGVEPALDDFERDGEAPAGRRFRVQRQRSLARE